MLYVNETGKRSAPSLVFLHGIGTSGWMWWRQIAALADFHCLNVDLPGHGKSNQVPWVSLADTAQQIAMLIRARATNGQAHMVGLSLGGYLALEMLDHHAGSLDRVILSGVTSAPMPNRSLLTPQLWLMSLLMRRRWVMRRQARALHLPPDVQVAFVENWLAMSMQTYRRIAEEVVDYRAPASLGGVNTPTLIAAGGRESRIIKQAVPAIAAILPNAQGCFAPGLGHGWNVEAPDLFSAMVRAWISGKSLPAGLQTGRNLRDER